MAADTSTRTFTLETTLLSKGKDKEVILSFVSNNLSDILPWQVFKGSNGAVTVIFHVFMIPQIIWYYGRVCL